MNNSSQQGGRVAKYGFFAAFAVIVANMIGTGVFTSLGFQLVSIKSGFAILALWAAGGVSALSGALSYAELGSALPRSGGEYNFLSRIYHPAAGFVSGWVSSTIGFAAPVALAAITFAAYVDSVLGEAAPPGLRPALACALVLLMTLVHAGRRSASSTMQTIFTLIKIMVILGFCAAVFFWRGDLQPVRLLPSAGDGGVVASGAFAVSLIYVSYAFQGWNAATYLSGEIEKPQHNLPLILGAGTALVMTLYIALNAAFLKAAPMEALVGRVEIGFIAAQAVFGSNMANVVSLVMASLLISTASAMTIAGPRVLQMIGEDFPALGFLARVNREGIPSLAIMVQSGLAIIFILTSSFDSILVFAGFALALNTFFAVLGVYILRWRAPDLPRPYRTFGYPFTPAIYLALTGWTLVYVLLERPVEALFALGLIAAGLLFYGLMRLAGREKAE
ncbi:MAG: amino acid permease [Parvularculaceae bacterium]